MSDFKTKLSWFIANQRKTIYEGFKGYKYFKNGTKKLIENLDIQCTDKELSKLSIEKYWKAKGKFLLLILSYTSIAVFCGLVLTKLFMFLYAYASKSVINLSSALNTISSDAWLGFWGSVLGSIVTMVGIIITIKFERRKEDINRMQQSQPIVMLQHRRRDDVQTQEKYNGSYSINFCSYRGDEQDYTKYSLQLPDIILRNIGFNAAINIELQFFIEGWKSQSGSGLDYLPSNGFEAFKVEMSFFKEELDKQFSDVRYAKNKGFLHAYFLSAYSNLRPEFHDKIVSVRNKTGNLMIQYRDVYGNEYYHDYGLSLFLVGLKDESYVAYLSYPTYSRKVKLRKKKPSTWKMM